MKIRYFKGYYFIILVIFSLLYINSSNPAYAIPVGFTIKGNADFEAAASLYGFPGSGTSSAPYLIQNFIMSAGAANFINISNTDVYFEIRSNNLTGSTSSLGVINLNNVTHATIVDNILKSNLIGIKVEKSQAISVVSNIIDTNDKGIQINTSENIVLNKNSFNNNTDSVLVINSNDTLIDTNTFESSASYALYSEYAHNLTFLFNLLFNNFTFGNNVNLNYSQANFNNNQIFGGLTGVKISNSINNLISNNKIEGTNSGFDVLNSDYNEINNNSFFQTGIVGLLITNSLGNSISHNFFSSYTNQGIQIKDASWNNTVMKNRIESGGYGILLVNTSQKNAIKENYMTDLGFGIYFTDSNKSIAENNTIFNSSTGISIFGGYDNVVQYNNATKNTFGYHISTINASVENNLAKSNLGESFYISGSNSTFENNVAETSNLGFDISNSYFITLKDNYLNNVSIGIKTDASSYGSIFNNRINNMTTGILQSSSLNWKIENNTIENLNTGIELNSVSGTYIESNTILKANNSGIRTLNSDNLSIRFNVIENSNSSLNLENSNFVSIENNEIVSNINGISLVSSSDNSLTNNSISDTLTRGMELLQSDHNYIEYNLIKNSSGYALYITGSSNDVFHNDFISSNIGSSSQAFDSGNNTRFSANYWDDLANTIQIDPQSRYLDDFYLIDGIGNNIDLFPLAYPITIAVDQQSVSSAPVGVSISVRDSGVIELQWNSPTDDGGSSITQYRIYRGIESGNYNIIFFTTSTTFSDYLVTNEVTYFYVISAVNLLGESDFSSEVSAVSFKSQGKKPSAPSDLVLNTKNNFITLSWNAPSSNGSSPIIKPVNIIKYYIYRGTESGEYNLIFFTSKLSFTDTLVESGVTYYYVVTAVNSVGESNFSNEVSHSIINFSQTPSTTSGVEEPSSTAKQGGSSPGFTLVMFLPLIFLLVFYKKRKIT